MSVEAPARRTDAKITFDGTDISAEMRRYLISVSYTDSEEDEADDLQITLQDKEGLWMQDWMMKLILATQDKTEEKKELPETVYWGCTGETVRMLQELLMSAGYSLPAFGADGVFGGETYAAVFEFQKTFSNAPDGICGPNTWGALLGGADGSQGATIRAAFIRHNWITPGRDEVCGFGCFTLDSVGFSGPPSNAIIRATALNFNADIRQTEKSKSWENYTLSGIASEMTASVGMSLMFLADADPFYKREEQFKESNIAFLKRLCHAAGLSLKSYDNMLVIFDQAKQEAEPPQFTIQRRTELSEAHISPDYDYISWDLNAGKAETQYTSCRVSYNDPVKGCIEGIAKIEDYDETENKQQLEIAAKVESAGEAMTMAQKYLRLHNKFCQTAEFVVPGNPALAAGVTGMLKGWGGFDGKYIIRQAVHTLDDNGYTTAISLRKVLEGY